MLNCFGAVSRLDCWFISSAADDVWVRFVRHESWRCSLEPRSPKQSPDMGQAEELLFDNPMRLLLDDDRYWIE